MRPWRGFTERFVGMTDDNDSIFVRWEGGKASLCRLRARRIEGSTGLVSMRWDVVQRFGTAVTLPGICWYFGVQ